MNSVQVEQLICKRCKNPFFYDSYGHQKKYCGPCAKTKKQERERKRYHDNYVKHPRLAKSQIIMNALENGAILSADDIKMISNSKVPRALITYLRRTKKIPIKTSVQTVYYLEDKDEKV